MNAQPAKMEFTIKQLCDILNAELFGDAGITIEGLSSIDLAGPTQMCFASSQKNARKVSGSKAAAVIVKEKISDITQTQLIVKNVDDAVIKVLTLFAPKLRGFSGIHKTAVIEDDAVVGENVSIGPNSYIGSNVQIGPDSIIGANCTICENTVIGSNTKIDSGVVIYHNCTIGSNCMIQSNSSIGAIGFGYSFIDGEHKMVPHNGGVLIEDCVHLGANVCVDRAKFGNTVVGAGTKVDNLAQFGHGAIVGKCCLIVSGVAIGGSTKLGDGVIVGGLTGIADNLEISPGVMIAAHSGVMQNLPPGSKVAGAPAIDVKAKFREVTMLGKMPEILKEFKKVVARVEKLEASKDNKN